MRFPNRPLLNKMGTLEAKLAHMTTAPVEGLVCRMAVPTIVIMSISSIYNIADTYFVSHLGTPAMAAVGVAFPLITIIQACGFFFGHGAGNYLSRQLGAGNIEAAESIIAIGFYAALITGTLVGGFGLFFLEPLARMLGAPLNIQPQACEYLRFILMGAPWTVPTLTLSYLFRFQGNAFYGMLGIATGALLNIGLDVLFIFIFNLGLSGASLATMLSQLVSMCILLLLSRRRGNIPVRLTNFHVKTGDTLEIFRGGFPSLCRQVLTSVAAVSFNHVAGAFGYAVIAAISIVQRVTMFAVLLLIGWGQGFQPVCGFNFGAGCFGRVKRAFVFCVKSSTFALSTAAIIGFVYAHEIIAFFRIDDPDVIRIGTLALRIQCVVLPLRAWTILNNMMLQSMGRVALASIMTIARQALFFLPLLFVLPSVLGILGVQLAYPLSDVATLFVSIPIGYRVLQSLPSRDGPRSGQVAMGERILISATIPHHNLDAPIYDDSLAGEKPFG